MTPEKFDAAARALPAATMDVQWGGENVYKVGGKMFAVLGTHGGCSFKVSDIAFEAMTEAGIARAAPYLARAKWVRLDDLSVQDAAEVEDWLKSAHGLVAAKLTKVKRRELGLA